MLNAPFYKASREVGSYRSPEEMAAAAAVLSAKITKFLTTVRYGGTATQIVQATIEAGENIARRGLSQLTEAERAGMVEKMKGLQEDEATLNSTLDALNDADRSRVLHAYFDDFSYTAKEVRDKRAAITARAEREGEQQIRDIFDSIINGDPDEVGLAIRALEGDEAEVFHASASMWGKKIIEEVFSNAEDAGKEYNKINNAVGMAGGGKDERTYFTMRALNHLAAAKWAERGREEAVKKYGDKRGMRFKDRQ